MTKQLERTTTLTFSKRASQATFVTDPSKPSWDDCLTKVYPEPESYDGAERQEGSVKAR